MRQRVSITKSLNRPLATRIVTHALHLALRNACDRSMHQVSTQSKIGRSPYTMQRSVAWIQRGRQEIIGDEQRPIHPLSLRVGQLIEWRTAPLLEEPAPESPPPPPVLRRANSISDRCTAIMPLSPTDILRRRSTGALIPARQLLGAYTPHITLYYMGEFCAVARLTQLLPQQRFEVTNIFDSFSNRLGVDHSRQRVRYLQLRCQKLEQYDVICHEQRIPIQTKVCLLEPMTGPLISDFTFLRAPNRTWVAVDHRHYKDAIGVISSQFHARPSIDERVDHQRFAISLIKFFLNDDLSQFESKQPDSDEAFTGLFQSIARLPAELRIKVLDFYL